MIAYAVVAAFAIAYHGEITAYRDAATFVMPNAVVSFEAIDGPSGDYRLRTDAGIAVQVAARKWRWTAPARPGTYELKFDGPGAKNAITMRAFVMVPATEVRNGPLNGYRIGAYPSKPLHGNPQYLPPKGFVEVTQENQDARVSPHFTLKQFLCKEDTSKQYPKYLVLQDRLPLKLEAILARVNGLGANVDTLHVMSGYRTPFYNRAIGDVAYSLHQWGSAADIYITTHDDSKRLYDEIDALLAEHAFVKFQGGLGYYPATRAHPPFVHVDVRGTPARWKG